MENIILQGQLIAHSRDTEIQVDFWFSIQKSGCADCVYSPTEVATWPWSEHRRDSHRQFDFESRTCIAAFVDYLDLLMILARCGPFQSAAIPNIFKSVWRHMEAAYGILG